MPEQLYITKFGRSYWMESNSWFANRIMQSNQPYQARNLKAVQKLVPHSRTTLDIGANVGMNAIEYAGFSKKVFAFEPHPTTFDRLKRTIEENRIYNVYPINLGAGAESEIRWMHEDKTNEGAARIAQDNRGTQIQTAKLDDWNWQDVDFIKLDIEGYEPMALQGLEDTILRCRPIIQCEIVPHQLKRFGFTPQHVFNWILDRDYRIENYRGEDVGRTWVKERTIVDYFFIPNPAKE